MESLSYVLKNQITLKIEESPYPMAKSAVEGQFTQNLKLGKKESELLKKYKKLKSFWADGASIIELADNLFEENDNLGHIVLKSSFF